MTAGKGKLTGRKVLLIALVAFGIILAANLTMMFAATGTFPGLVVKNSYVASQEWNDRVAAQQATGWQIAIGYDDTTLEIGVQDDTGKAAPGLTVTAFVGRPANDSDDRKVTFVESVDGYLADLALAPGMWRIDAIVAGPGGETAEVTGEILVPDR